MMSFKALKREDEDAALYFYDRYDYTQAEIAKMYGVSRTTIQRALKNAQNRAQHAPPVAPDRAPEAQGWAEVTSSVNDTGHEGTSPVFVVLAVLCAVLGASLIGWFLWNAFQV